MLVLAGVVAAIFVCLRFFRMPAEVAAGLVAMAFVLSVVADVVKNRPH
jgi:hypothetical protein